MACSPLPRAWAVLASTSIVLARDAHQTNIVLSRGWPELARPAPGDDHQLMMLIPN